MAELGEENRKSRDEQLKTIEDKLDFGINEHHTAAVLLMLGALFLALIVGILLGSGLTSLYYDNAILPANAILCKLEIQNKDAPNLNNLSLPTGQILK